MFRYQCVVMEHVFICPRCGNKDLEKIGVRNGQCYCRACISFQGKMADRNYQVKKGIRLELSYPLSLKQKEISDAVKEKIQAGENVLIHAVTGAGKTELVYQTMEMVLLKGGHVGFATPRKDVVIDLMPRMKEAFKNAKVIGVYGEHNQVLEGDIIVLTAHQLYRYEKYFDLLIFDEIDAFPYAGNEILKHFFYQSVSGNYVLLSATPSPMDKDEILKHKGSILHLDERYHGKPLPEPHIVVRSPLSLPILVIRLLFSYHREQKPVFVFVPTIAVGKQLFSLLSLFFKKGMFVSSKEESRRLSIERFKSGELSYLVTTSILERGVTVKNLQVIVYRADHDVYDAQSLVQIAGRAGRKIDAPLGEVYFLCQEENDEIKKARSIIHGHNRKANLV